MRVRPPREVMKLLSSSRLGAPSAFHRGATGIGTHLGLPFLGICVGPIPRVFGDILPQGDTQTIRMVICNLPAEQRQNALQLPVAHDLSAAGTAIGEVSLYRLEYGD